MDAKSALLVALAVFTVFYVTMLVMGIAKAKAERAGESATPTPTGLAIGAVTNFFDTLGIGSFATTTSAFRFTRMVPDERIPGTLNVGHTLPTIAQAFIFTKLIPVDSRTLVLLILASVAGAWLGAGVVARLSRRAVQIGMGGALFAAALLFTLKNIDGMRATPLFPGGEALALHGALLAAAMIGNFALGALMTLGIGLYAPSMIMISLLGMNPTAAFPIMMGSCAFLMPVSSARFIKERSFDVRAVLGLLIGGIPAVLVAALVVKSLPLTYVRWLVVVVVLYAAVGLLRTAARERKGGVT